MATPRNREARMFYRASLERFQDAEFLLAGRTTAAVYLAGYSVECILKALILASLPPGPRAKMLLQFRGGKAHDYDWLRERYRLAGGPTFPNEINAAFALVEVWETELRYNPKQIKVGEAKEFLGAAKRICQWADERL